MPRPKRPRQIVSQPSINEFRPDSGHSLEIVVLSLEEMEAIRLIDYEGMDQSQAAELMNVSRQTVGRILKAGRHALSKALVEGSSLKIQGGCYRMRNGHGGGRGIGRRSRGQAKGLGCGRGRGSGSQQDPSQP